MRGVDLDVNSDKPLESLELPNTIWPSVIRDAIAFAAAPAIVGLLLLVADWIAEGQGGLSRSLPPVVILLACGVGLSVATSIGSHYLSPSLIALTPDFLELRFPTGKARRIRWSEVRHLVVYRRRLSQSTVYVKLVSNDQVRDRTKWMLMSSLIIPVLGRYTRQGITFRP